MAHRTSASEERAREQLSKMWDGGRFSSLSGRWKLLLTPPVVPLVTPLVTWPIVPPIAPSVARPVDPLVAAGADADGREERPSDA